MNDDISAVARRTRRWKFEAGTTEIILGGLFFWAGLALLVPRTPMFSLVIFVPGLILTGTLTDHLQRRYIIPRIGYVEYRENTGKGFGRLLLLMAFSLVTFGGLVALFFHFIPETAPLWIAPSLAIFIAILLIPYGVQSRLARLVLLGLISIVTGLLFSPLVPIWEPFRDSTGIGSLVFFLLVMGIVFFFSGGCAFRSFLHRNPLPREEKQA
jgi:hypothetical protein